MASSDAGRDLQEQAIERAMRRAIELAIRASGRTNPNPLVGAVILRHGQVIGEGWHTRFGDMHAEREALADCRRRGNDPAGATVCVTLEPCNHTGHQPPCVDALIEARVARVVVGSRDPNPLVNGAGNARLRDAGIEVVEDVLRDECDAINQVFFHYMTERTPYVVAKWGMSADGKIACASGDARWVTGELARAHGHALRNRLAAIMVGAGTVRADDPLLTCRLEGGRNPVRIVCDARLSAVTPRTRLAQTAREIPLLVATCAPDPRASARDLDADVRASDPSELKEWQRRADALRDMGAEVLEIPGMGGAGDRVDLKALMDELARREIDSVLLEGGPTLHAQALASGIVNEIVAYVAPKVIGGAKAPGAVGGAGVPCMAQALALGVPRVAVLGEDVRLSWRIGDDEKSRSLPCVSAQQLGPVWDRALADSRNASRSGAQAGERQGE